MCDSDDDQAMCANAAAFANDDDDDVAATVFAAEHHLGMLDHMIGDFHTRRGGSLPGKAPNKQRDLVSGERGLLRDYFGVDGDPPVYVEKDFIRRFRLPHIVFDRVYRDLLSEPYFQQRLNATGEPQASTLHKLTAALRVLASGVAYGSVDECVPLSEPTVCETVHRFARFVVGK